MSLTLLDFIVFGIMIASGFLALMRGFTRELLSLFAWVVAAIATYFVYMDGRLSTWAMNNVPYLEDATLAKIAAGAAVFLVVLIIISIISVKISDYVVDSAAGAFDRTLGFLFGLARGAVFIAIAYMFYVMWLVPETRHEAWIKDSLTLPLIQTTSDGLFALLPVNMQENLRASSISSMTSSGPNSSQSESGYKSNEDQGLENLIQGTGETQQPAFGQSNTQ